MKSFLYIGLLALSLCLPRAAVSQSPLAEEYMSMAIRGDLRDAERLFRAVPPGQGQADAELAALFQARFIAGSERRRPPFPDAGVDAVLSAYRNYWKEGLLHADYSAAERKLLAVLEASVKKEFPGDREPDEDVYALVQGVLSGAGYYALTDFAAPLQDLIVWTRQRPAQFTVDLGDQVLDVEVLFLSGFLSQGWKHYASLDMATTTGWVEDGRLYCVEWAYRPGSEAFDISFLKHESRHLADYRQFPGLEAGQLEYRAKLTELAFAHTTQQRLLQDFASKSAAESGSPHAEANARVIEDLHRALYGREADREPSWTGVEVRRVNRAALELLQSDTQLLEERYAGRR